MRKSRNSIAIEISKRRLEKLRSIAPDLDFGGGMSIPNFSKAIDELDDLQAAYNQSLSVLDGQLSIIKRKEEELREMRDRFLKLVGGKYGTDSIEFLNAGGVPKSERKRRQIMGRSKVPKES
ncbi:MAG TPA: hypothetical protein VK169_07495 [Saprospiraceae bacterium]|nr:hypothetical protein [Saprospiraceae bacterium]